VTESIRSHNMRQREYNLVSYGLNYEQYCWLVINLTLEFAKSVVNKYLQL